MAMTTDIINGTDLLLYVEGVAVAGATTHSLTLNSETRDTTNKDTAKWRTVRGGRLTWGLSGSGMFSFDATFGHAQLMALLIAGTVVTLKFSTEVAGNTHYSGEAIITKCDMEAPDGQNTTYSYEFVGYGPLASATTT
jgi:predicted secreted protein